MTPKPCKWCGGRRWIVMGDEVVRCWCVKPTDLTEDNSALRGRRDGLRAAEAAEDGLDVDAKQWARDQMALD